MNEQGLLIAAFVLAAASFAVSLWSLAVGLLNAERRKEDHQDGAIQQIIACITKSRTQLDVSERKLRSDPDSLEARREYDAAALGLAASYEDLCAVVVKMRKDAESRLAKAYGDEIRQWVEDGPLREKYRWRVPEYPATAEVLKMLRSRSGSSGARAA